MKNLCGFSVLCCVVMSGWLGAAQAASPTFVKSAKPAPRTTTVLSYDVYAGGIHALDAGLAIRKTSGRYDVALTAETQGLLKSMANWSGKFTTGGVVKSGQLYPQKHRSESTWKDSTETKTFTYDGKGHFVSYKVSEEGQDKTPKDIDAGLAKGAVDNLSATMRVMLALPRTGTCAGSSLVFDGDRSYRLTFADPHKEDLKKSDYNIYEGPSVSCTVEVTPEKGKWRKKPRGWLSIQEQGRQKGALPKVWFGTVAGQPDYAVPVKIRIKTDYGTLFLHLTGVQSRT